VRISPDYPLGLLAKPEYRELKRRRIVNARIATNLIAAYHQQILQLVPSPRQPIRKMAEGGFLEADDRDTYILYLLYPIFGSCAALFSFSAHLRIFFNAISSCCRADSVKSSSNHPGVPAVMSVLPNGRHEP
jgi:hypothetical protein